MNNDMLEIIKKEYENKKLIRDDHNRIVSEIKALQRKKDVLNYLAITNKMDELNKYSYDEASDDDILYDIFIKNIGTITDDKDTNDIYVYMSTDVIDDQITSTYWNLEMSHPIRVLIKDAEEFENNHTILKSSFNAVSVKEVIEIQKAFISKAVSSNQDKARKLVIRRYNNKK